MFKKILIANRGEIACRIIRTARRLGIKTVAVYSEADAGALHTRLADEAFAIGPAPSAQSYLDAAKLIAVASVAGAEAIHPGYGFLSENAEFAATIAAAGITFIGPDEKAIRIMGSKSEAKALVAQHDVPLVPGYYGADQSLSRLISEARMVGLPLLIKAIAGGGGRGMRIVRDFAEFEAALASAQREAQSAFGNATVLIERYIEHPRHIEVQVFGDKHGNLVHLFERDCSLQRRHQKVIEEAPAVLLTEAQRATLFDAALRAARAVDYVGAGTVEFIIDRQGAIYFIEMNTRLQVEHPVTELVTGFDLVEWQLRVAAGEPLPVRQSEILCRGHAVEVRLYAEDPAHDFRASIGELVHLRFPDSSDSVRVDTGVVCGDSVTPYYDAMVAKIITRGRDRAEALQQMRACLAETEVVGVNTNTDYLQRILTHPRYCTGGFNTHFVEDERASLTLDTSTTCVDALLLLAAVYQHAENARIRQAEAARSAEPHSPWVMLTGFRINAASTFEFEFKTKSGNITVEGTKAATGWSTTVAGRNFELLDYSLDGSTLSARCKDRTLHASIVRSRDELHVFFEGTHYCVQQVDRLHSHDDTEINTGALIAPMPGAITSVMVKVGDQVARGAPLLILEAMKIEHTITAPCAGTVSEIRFSIGEQVTAEGVELIKITPNESAAT
ncbi:MAG: acetyl-CoA carboxylase biotin carboxylase subunit [Gammaproteobacteria bacterium]|nr:acetyl-CoA carboxylase biotin carboxylase subunit [Gammaproteobacteria bacterium]